MNTKSRKPDVSIILPTYNRADTIMRAVDSVLRQTFEDWELLIIDDGSTDGTCDVVDGVDSRIRVVRQENAGTYVARNRGLDESAGRLITFLDSDDEWLPHYLEITTAFLNWSPDDHFVICEYEDENNGLNWFRWMIENKYAPLARAIGVSSLDLPLGQTDEYLRVYDTKEPIGPWGSAIAKHAGVSDGCLYRGNIFNHMRWGYLAWLPTTVLTRHALETVGPFVTTCRNAADGRFLALLAKHFRANMIGFSCAVKYDTGLGASALCEDHLATGKNAYLFSVNHLRFFDELYWSDRKGDRELSLIRSYRHLYAGRTALRAGLKSEALVHLRQASQPRPLLWHAYVLRVFARLFPSGDLAGKGYRFVLKCKDVLRRVLSGEMRLRTVLKKLGGAH